MPGIAGQPKSCVADRVDTYVKAGALPPDGSCADAPGENPSATDSRPGER